MVETAVGRHNKIWYCAVKSACASGRYLFKSVMVRLARASDKAMVSREVLTFSFLSILLNYNENTTIFLNITHSFGMKCSFSHWFESSRRPRGRAVWVLNPLIFSTCVEFPCHLVGVQVGWIQTTGFAYAAPTVVITDNRGIIFSKRFHLPCM